MISAGKPAGGPLRAEPDSLPMADRRSEKAGVSFVGAYRSHRTVNGRPTAYCEAHTRLGLSDNQPDSLVRAARFLEAAE